MKNADIKDMQRRIGLSGADVDGFWGPRSIAACQRHLKRIWTENSKRAFPSQSQVASGKSIYGRHGEPNGYEPPGRSIRLPFVLHLYGDATKPVATLAPHEQVADSLLCVFQRLAEAYPTRESRKAAGILDYYGLYNPRSMRGGSAWSMHAWKIAIDLDAGRNGNATHWPSRAVMPLPVMECFAAEGWLSAGAFWSRDAMHFQATGM